MEVEGLEVDTTANRTDVHRRAVRRVDVDERLGMELRVDDDLLLRELHKLDIGLDADVTARHHNILDLDCPLRRRNCQGFHALDPLRVLGV